MQTQTRMLIPLLMAMWFAFSPPARAQTADLQTMIETVEQMPLTPASEIPRSGQFYSAKLVSQGVYVPLYPANVLNAPSWNLGNGAWLINDLNSSGMRTMTESGPPIPGIGGGTNNFNFHPQVFTTNDLWLQMLSASNGMAHLVIHPPWDESNGVYDLYYCTNLISPAWQWLLRTEAGQTNVTVANASNAQGFYQIRPPDDLAANDSLGTNFWLAFFYMDYDGANNLSLAISSPMGATGEVIIPQLSMTNDFTVAAGAVTNISVPNWIMMFDNEYDEVGNNGIQVIADALVSVYGLDYDAAASAAFTGYPTPLLGTNYCLITRAGENSSFNSELGVLATEDDTTVTIIPSTTADLWDRDTGLTHSNAYTEVLQRGQTYQVNSRRDDAGVLTNDVTGTWVTADKPVAVFAGADLADIPDNKTQYGNPLMQEQMPVADWGKEALALSFAGRLKGDLYRVLAAYDDTMVTITTTNGIIVTNLAAGTACETNLDGPVTFQANQPIQVAQFANGTTFDNPLNTEGDPCEILLSPTGHYLQTNVVFSLNEPDAYGNPNLLDEHYLNLIIPQSAVTNTLVDGLIIDSTNFVPIGTSGYYGAQISVESGSHTVTSSEPIGVEVYGWGFEDSYSYFGGIVK